MYYTKNILLSTLGVPAIMSQQKFIAIEKHLHFVHYPQHSRRAKIAPIFILLIHSIVIIYQKEMFSLMNLYCSEEDAYPGNNTYIANTLISH